MLFSSASPVFVFLNIWTSVLFVYFKPVDWRTELRFLWHKTICKGPWNDDGTAPRKYETFFFLLLLSTKRHKDFKYVSLRMIVMKCLILLRLCAEETQLAGAVRRGHNEFTSETKHTRSAMWEKHTHTPELNEYSLLLNWFFIRPVAHCALEAH